MATLKTYTHNPCGPLSKNHKLVIAAYQKGLTGIKIIRGLGKGADRTGWTLECDQVPKLHLGYEIAEAEIRINQILVKGTGFKELFRIFESGVSPFTELSFVSNTPVNRIDNFAMRGQTEYRIDFVMMAPGLVTEISGYVKAYTEHEAATKVLQISELYK